MSVLPSNTVLRTVLQLGGERGVSSLSCPQSSGCGVEGTRGLAVSAYLGSPKSECVHWHCGPQSHHFLVDSHVAAYIYVGPSSSVSLSLSVHHGVLPV